MGAAASTAAAPTAEATLTAEPLDSARRAELLDQLASGITTLDGKVERVKRISANVQAGLDMVDAVLTNPFDRPDTSSHKQTSQINGTERCLARCRSSRGCRSQQALSLLSRRREWNPFSAALSTRGMSGYLAS